MHFLYFVQLWQFTTLDVIQNPEYVAELTMDIPYMPSFLYSLQNGGSDWWLLKFTHVTCILT